MPLDSSGKFRHNSQVAAMHSKGKEEKPALGEPKEGETEEHTEVHNHGDGTFHTVHQGEEEQHETIGHLHAKLSSLHGEPGERHFHAHEGAMGTHSHAVETGGEAEHRDHEDPQGAVDHLQEHVGGEQEQEPQEQNESAIGGY